ncbi:hypothetical protein INR76_07780 [Marixanthomonas sp. SCSIO 43207]|uniref:hypothetical protein n=1 Tax=Marixanthomonas sp. SCSIO 43207 TaxID=2779360 RepID=UPI001CA7FD34|nr:hypothetical protein [Marixanthomonas sp. SCSIO 43207]UAB80037.1 hypothetical protein INR76_07780 [Marixanthomonas sp. SCSIO 43207]
MKQFFKKNKRALYGGLIATLFTGLGVFLLGNLTGYEAKKLISTSLSGINMLCNTIILASATILALLLTLLGISTGTDSKLKKDHYVQVLSIAKFDTILFVSALILFQLFNIPITEANNVPTSWYTMIYWTTLFFSSVISGMMIAVILMLYGTVTNIIHIVGLGKNHYLVQDNKDNDEDEHS